MPIKRKASETTLASEPPARRLRSGGPEAVIRTQEPKPKAATKSRTRAVEATLPKRAAKPPSKAVASASVETRSQPVPAKRRGRPPGIPAAEFTKGTTTTVRAARAKPATAPASKEQKPRSSARLNKPPPSKVTRKPKVQATPEEAAEDDPEADELNITPTAPLISRPSTPLRQNVKSVYVEVPTPKQYARMLQAVAGSPMAISRSPAPGETRKLLHKSPHLSPTKRAQTILPPSPSPTRRANIILPPSPSPSQPRIQPFTTPSKKHAIQTPLNSPSRLPNNLPTHLHPCLSSQKRAILQALRNPPEITEDEEDESISTNAVAYEDVYNLLNGTVNRGEGNSCLLIGPRGSGKTRLVEKALNRVSEKVTPIIIRLSGHAQRDDRLAMREIAWQLTQQTGKSFLSEEEEEQQEDEEIDEKDTMTLPPPAHLPALISVLPSQPRPVVVILDAFDYFALHGRQALLYCLLDTAQSCRVGTGLNGIAVVGVTSRVDTINLLEKRVKSRFSGRMFRTAGPSDLEHWKTLTRSILTAPIDSPHEEEWSELWGAAVERFLTDRKVVSVLHETWALAKDVRVLSRVLTTPVLDLSPTSPFPSARHLTLSIAAQRFPIQFSYLPTLSYPSICLLIAAIHTQTAGHDTFTFEMLYQAFRDQVRTSMSAPVQVDGGSIGMVKCGRHTLMGAFEQLANVKAFVPITAPLANVAQEFVKYRCVVHRDDVKKTVDKGGQMSLKKWLGKSQQG